MDKRVWWVVGLFGSVGIAATTWVVLSAGPGPRSTSTEGGFEKPAKAKTKSKAKADPVVSAAGHKAPRRTVDEVRTPNAARFRDNPEMMPVDLSGARSPGQDAAGVWSLDQDGVSSALATRWTDLEACWKTATLHTPDLPPKLLLGLAVTPSETQGEATLTAVDADTPLDATVFETCAATVVAGLRFSATEATTLRFPIDFSAPPPAPPPAPAVPAAAEPAPAAAAPAPAPVEPAP